MAICWTGSAMREAETPAELDNLSVEELAAIALRAVGTQVETADLTQRPRQ